MPQYVYSCDNPACLDEGSEMPVFEFEITQAMSDDHVANCPKCGRRGKRVLFPVGVAFKGSGFHVNDYPSRR